MKKYNVIIQPEAEAELDDAFDYLESKQTTLGFDLLAEVADTIQLLEDNPFLFQKVTVNIRRVVTKKFRYNISFIIEDLDIYVIAIQHGNRKPNNFLDRLF